MIRTLSSLMGAILALTGCAQSKAAFASFTPPGLESLRDTYHLSPGVRAGEFVILSGVIGTEQGAPPKDAEAEFTRAWEQIAATLAYAGLAPSDVVEIVSYHTDMSKLGVFASVKDRYIQAPYPAWSAIGVNALAVPGARAEIKVTARAR